MPDRQNENVNNQSNAVEVVEEKKRPTNTLEFVLVLVMLGVLTLLLTIMVFFPILASGKGGAEGNKELIDYSKWIVTALLAAFGAWIGAGAAYFFGKSNLMESSRSTEEALKIQRGYLRGPQGVKYIKDLNLTAMNTNFLFNQGKPAGDVAKGLNKHTGYWFVPMIDEKDGVLQDVIHARVFWTKTFTDETIESVIDEMDNNPDLKDLHGDGVFYSKVKPNDTIKEVYELMKAKKNAVAIVVDEKNKPTHCLTRTDLGSIIQAKETD